MIWNCNDVGLFDVCTFTVTLKLCESFLQRRYYPLGLISSPRRANVESMWFLNKNGDYLVEL